MHITRIQICKYNSRLALVRSLCWWCMHAHLKPRCAAQSTVKQNNAHVEQIKFTLIYWLNGCVHRILFVFLASMASWQRRLFLLLASNLHLGTLWTGTNSLESGELITENNNDSSTNRAPTKIEVILGDLHEMTISQGNVNLYAKLNFAFQFAWKCCPFHPHVCICFVHLHHLEVSITWNNRSALTWNTSCRCVVFLHCLSGHLVSFNSHFFLSCSTLSLCRYSISGVRDIHSRFLLLLLSTLYFARCIRISNNYCRRLCLRAIIRIYYLLSSQGNC